MTQLEFDLQDDKYYWKRRYEDLLEAYIKLEEKNYALRTSVDLLKDVALENGKAG